MQDLAGRPFATFSVKRSPRAVGGPESLTSPARLGIVDPTVHPFGIKSHRIRDAKYNEFSTVRHQRKKCVISVTRGNRHVLPQSESIELIDPIVVTGFGASWVANSLQLRTRELIQLPAFRALLPRRGWPIERPFT